MDEKIALRASTPVQFDYEECEFKEKNQPLLFGRKLTAVVYSFGYETDACSVIRILGPMRAGNWNVIWATKRNESKFLFDLDDVFRADVIIIQRQFPRKFTEKILKFIIKSGVPIVYDIDDLFFDIPSYHSSYHTVKDYLPYIKWIIREADIITVSTIPIKKSLSKYTRRPIHVVPNVIDFNLFAAPTRVRNQQFNFLVSGSKTHQRDWAIIEEPIAEILNKYEKKVNVIYFGDVPKRFFGHPSVKVINFQPNYNQYAAQLKGLEVHAALIPLESIEFNYGKSNIKWLEYSATGIPGIYSDITPYNSCIRHEHNGLLVKNDQESWFNAMNQLIVNSEKTTHIIKNAQREILKKHSIKNSVNEYTSVINSLYGYKHKQRILSELPIFHYQLYDNITNLINKHVTWRFKN